MRILVTGYAGYDGSRLIYEDGELRTRLLERYTESFLARFRPGEGPGLNSLFAKKKALGLAEASVDGGVLAALWRLLKRNRSGGTYNMRAIPILQQTVELCEVFGLDPYRLYAPSCMLWLADDAELDNIIDTAAACGIPYSIMGRTAGGTAIVRTDTVAASQLRRPVPDELTKMPERLWTGLQSVK